MSRIHMAGFSADSSLFRTDSVYRGQNVLAPTKNSGIQPAFPPPPNCIRQCQHVGSEAPCASFACECECAGGHFSHSGLKGSCGNCTFHR
jgi:hypothetical protein